jgi:hypothetical protein
VRSPRCPLCDAPVDDDAALRAHLADAHDLRDDPGTETRVGDVVAPFYAGPAGGREDGGLLAEAPVVLPTRHVHDPDADDARWRPITIGVGGILLLVLAAVALQLVS